MCLKFLVPLAVLWLLLPPHDVAAQNPNPGPIAYEQGAFSSHFEIKGQRASKSEVRLNLEKSTPEAYFKFRRGQTMENQTILFLIVAAAGGGMVVSQAIKSSKERNQTVYIAGYGALIGGGAISLVLSIGSDNRYQESVALYNKWAGY